MYKDTTDLEDLLNLRIKVNDRLFAFKQALARYKVYHDSVGTPRYVRNIPMDVIRKQIDLLHHQIYEIDYAVRRIKQGYIDG